MSPTPGGHGHRGVVTTIVVVDAGTTLLMIMGRTGHVPPDDLANFTATVAEKKLLPMRVISVPAIAATLGVTAERTEDIIEMYPRVPILPGSEPYDVVES